MIQNLQSELTSPNYSPTKAHDFRQSDLSPTKIRLQHSVSNATENQIFSGTFSQMNKKVIPRPAQEVKLTIQEALQRVGTNGRYQIICNIFFFLQWLIAGAVLNSPIFLFLKPTFECDNGLNGTECENWVCKQSNPLSFATYIPKSLVMQFDPPLICERQVIADSIIAITYSGSIAGFIISSYISDNKGRKFASLIFWIFAGIGSLLSGVLIQSPWLVAAGLFVSTFGVNPVITYVFCFINEHSDGKFREYSLALLNALFAIGAIYLAITQYITDNWIHLQIYFIAIPIIVSNLFYYYIQEPPIFLFQQDKKKAINILNHIAKINKKPQIKEEDLKEEPTSAEQIDQPQSKTTHTYGYLDLFKSKSILITTLCCSLILFIIQFHLYGTNLTFSSIGLEVKINTVIIYSAEAVSNLLTVYIIPKISRRKNGFLMIASNIVFLLFFFVKLPSDCDGFCSQKIAQTVLMGVARFLLGFQINIHQVYISELYPTSIRSIGIGFTSIVGVVGSIICGYFVTFFSVENLNPIGSMGIAGLLASLLYIPLKETLNQPLEDNIPEQTVQMQSIPSTNIIGTQQIIPENIKIQS
ncbi:MFS transporter (macronuclear) [Tetrahymena thermophila SB210]|uniref:MFS transporter n=1 Tax=Tetrahymena thermophila (strain SB210) TaxID=312017 RepID=I7MJI7_TETTS|nr:MFS transporter [Tetrahymena thermophila SB210]EAR96397.2 MFS transporter [Tetrahymena thermophila SB210]|eukprot:XP_001016642.2 MFS transporter [Tetrahymena thermophila SB210]